MTRELNYASQLLHPGTRCQRRLVGTSREKLLPPLSRQYNFTSLSTEMSSIILLKLNRLEN